MIVVFGGAFNPPTIAHYEVAKHVTKMSEVSKLLFVPVGDHYEKAGLVPAFHRVNMLEVLTRTLPKTSVSTIEIDANRAPKTMETLEKLQDLYPEKEIAFVMGADNLYDLPNWHACERLIKTFKFLVFNRQKLDAQRFIEKTFPKNKENFILVDDFITLDVSSTEYRTETDRSELLLPEMEAYIKQHGLYEG